MSAANPSDQQVNKPLLYVLGVVLLAGLAYVLLSLLGGSDEVDQAGSSVAVGSEPAAVEPDADASELPPVSDAPSEDAIDDVEPTFEVFSARDPFDQLVADTSDDAGTVDGTVGTTTPTSATVPTTQPVDGTTPVTTGDPSQGGTGTPSGGDPAQTLVGVTTILLEEVFTDGGVDKVVVVVDGEGYEAAEDETVADDLTILDIEGSCATMRLADTRFILCEGEQIQK